MKSTLLKNALFTVLITSVLGNAQIASADIYSQESLGATDSATDVFAMTCPKDTVKAGASVGNKLGGFAEFINVQVVAPHGRAVSINSRENAPSRLVTFSGGPGNYLVVVSKTASFNSEPYDINMDCFNSSNKALDGNQSTKVQDQ